MAQEQNYQVNYSINVDASQGTKQVIAFGEAVGKLVQAKASLTPAVTNIKNMMDEIDRVFRTKNGKKRNFDYRLTIDTKKSEEKLERIKGLLTDISTLSKGISLTINAGQALDSKKIKANAKSLYEKKAAEMRKAEIEKNAASSVGTMADAQKRITKAIGKINSALVSMERDRELQIKTGTAENRLQQILSLLGRIKSASVISFNMQGGIPSEGLTPSVPVPYAPQAFVMPEKARQKLMERLYAGQQLHRQKLVHAEELFTADQRRKAALAETAAAEKRRADEARAKERECKNAARAAEKIRRQAEQARRKAETERIKAEQAARRQEKRNVSRVLPSFLTSDLWYGSPHAAMTISLVMPVSTLRKAISFPYFSPYRFSSWPIRAVLTNSYTSSPPIGNASTRTPSAPSISRNAPSLFIFRPMSTQRYSAPSAGVIT